ncbi:uncharacterized protein LOC144348228 [Saccoglossus kowalevskii]
MSGSEDETNDTDNLARPVISVTITPRPYTTRDERRTPRCLTFAARPQTSAVEDMSRSKNGQQQIMELFRMRNRAAMPAICKDPVPICGQRVQLRNPGNNPSPSPPPSKSAYRPAHRYISLDIDLRGSTKFDCSYDDRPRSKVLMIKDSEIVQDPMPEIRLPKYKNQLSEPFMKKRVYTITTRQKEVKIPVGMKSVRDKLRTTITMQEKKEKPPTKQAWSAETSETRDFTQRHGKNKIIVFYSTDNKCREATPRPVSKKPPRDTTESDNSATKQAQQLDGCLYSCLKDSIHLLKQRKKGNVRGPSANRKKSRTPSIKVTPGRHRTRSETGTSVD